MISAPGPAEKLPETPYGAIPDHIEPGWKNGSTGPYRDQNTAVKAGTARVEALKAVDGGKAGFGVVEGEKLPVHGATVARCGAFRDRLEDGCQVLGKARLCGHVGDRISGTVGQDVRLGHLQDGDTGGHLVQAAPDDRLLHGEDAPAEPLVVPAAPLEGAVDE